MVLNNLRLQNFKNYKESSISFSPGLNFIYGNNGNGKTNLLEAVSFLCFTKSFMQTSESDCIKYGTDYFEISGAFENDLGVTHKVSLGYQRETGAKKFLLNNDPISKLSDFFGSFPLVVLSPQDMKLTTGTQGERRRNFDILISQVSRIYFDDLKKFNKIIKQKNSLLKENLVKRRYSPGELKRLLEAWNDELVDFAARIVIKRLEFIQEFKPFLSVFFKEIVGNEYEPVIDYQSEVRLSLNEQELKSSIAESLEEKFSLETIRGLSLIGPHRDHFVFSLYKPDGLFDVKIFASQGEHKTYITSLKLAEFSYLKEKLETMGTGEPIILLDDVFSDLDRNRIEKICRMLPMCRQIFLTTTNPDYLEMISAYSKSSNIQKYQIINGTAANNTAL